MISREPIFSIRCELANILDLGAAPFGHRRVVNIPPALAASIALTTATVVAVGVYPQLFARVGELATRFVS